MLIDKLKKIGLECYYQSMAGVSKATLNRVKIALFIVTALFVWKEIALINKATDKNWVDQVGASSSVYAAKKFVEHGMLGTAFLPIYPWVPDDITIDKLKKSFVYTHYFPGPEYVMTPFFAVFGSSSAVITWVRLFPMVLLVFSIFIFAFTAERLILKGWPWGKVLIIGALFLAPSTYRWGISLHGSAYSTVVLLLAMTLGLLCADKRYSTDKKFRMNIFLGAFVLGILSIYFLMTGSFVVFAGPLVGQLLARNSKKFSLIKILKESGTVTFVVGLGLVSGFLIHFVQIAIYLDSFSLALEDQIGTALRRGGKQTETPSRILLIGQYSGHVRGFFRINGLHQFWFGVFAAWMHSGQLGRRFQLFFALLVSLVASYAWVMVMRHHSFVHWHINPRIFMLLYTAFICTLLSLAVERKT